MRRYLPLSLLLLLAMHGSTRGTVDEEFLRKIKSPAAKKALDAYQKVVASAQAESDKKVSVAKENMLQDLAAAQEEATKAGYLDDAVLIRELRKRWQEPARKPRALKPAMQIQAALYGTNISWLDVTDKVRKALEGQAQVTIPVTNVELGDFYPGYTGNATLVVRYVINGHIVVKSAYRGDMLNLP